jgi:DNA repair exonuclease SbcCD nuclease subunit
VKFIHTADWQIGMNTKGMGKAGSLVRDSRVQSIDNIFKVAKKTHAEFILVCGDVFEDNLVSTEDVKKVISVINKYPEMPVYLLPGNHDYLGPGSVYKRTLFASIKNLTVFKDAEPVKYANVTLYPAPIEVNKRVEDPTSCIPNTSKNEGIRIGVAHGSLVGSFYTDQKIEFPIDSNCIQRTGLHYLALGHHHNKRLFTVDGVVRIAYSGTHEQTSFDETESGYCLLVEISDEKAVPIITPFKTGKLAWGLIEAKLSDRLSLSNLSDMLEHEIGKQILKLRVVGHLPFELKSEYDQLIEYHDTHHAFFKVDEDIDYVLPPDVSEIIEINDPIVKRTAECLRAMIEQETNKETQVGLVDSLGYLYKLVKEASQ